MAIFWEARSRSENIGKTPPGWWRLVTIRKDGVAILDVRATIETHDGALIDLSYWGILDMGDDGYEGFCKDGLRRVGQRSACLPAFPTSHSDYLWLNRLHCLGIGQAYLERAEVAYDVYAMC